MNFGSVVVSALLRFRFTMLAFMALVVAGTAISIAIMSQERALREGSARAAEKFDVIVAPSGSRTDALLTGVYLQPGTSRLLGPEITAAVLNDTSAAFASPLAFGDNYRGHPIVGTTSALPDHLSDNALAEGRMFTQAYEAVIGANVDLPLGSTIAPMHGLADLGEHGDEHSQTLDVVGRMQPTGSPWDNAIVAPVEFVWAVHGHEDDVGEEEAQEPEHEAEFHHEDHDHDDETIGGPYTVENPGVPAIVLRAASIADAYRLRSTYNTDTTMAFFPAEVLIDLFQTLGDVSFILFSMSMLSAALVIAAILCGLLIVFRLLTPQLITLRALGAPRRFIMGVAWGVSASIFTVGTLLGLGVGLLIATVISGILQSRTGIVLTPSLGQQEFTVLGAIWLLGVTAGCVPALYIATRPLWKTIRSY